MLDNNADADADAADAALPGDRLRGAGRPPPASASLESSRCASALASAQGRLHLGVLRRGNLSLGFLVSRAFLARFSDLFSAYHCGHVFPPSTTMHDEHDEAEITGLAKPRGEWSACGYCRTCMLGSMQQQLP